MTEMPGLRGSGRRHRGQANSGSGSQCHCCFSHAVLLYFSEEWECVLMSTRRKGLPKTGARKCFWCDLILMKNCSARLRAPFARLVSLATSGWRLCP